MLLAVDISYFGDNKHCKGSLKARFNCAHILLMSGYYDWFWLNAAVSIRHYTFKFSISFVFAYHISHNYLLHY